ncbi:hypothetical protein ACFLTH_18075 [Bacteroidota bacterium]
MKKNSKHGQVWSVDLIIGILVFVMIMTVFFVLLSTEKDSKATEFSDKADLVADKFYEREIVDSSGEFNREKFLEIADQYSYEELKEELGIVGEFCLYLELEVADPSSPTGKRWATIPITNSSGEGWLGIGSNDLNVSGYSCGTRWS